VAQLVIGAPVRGSWWSHPKSNDVYEVLEALEDSPEVLQMKLVRGKLTLLHRSVWPELVAVASAREPWQMRGLSRTARALLARVEGAGTLRLDELEGWQAATKPGDAARELETRLLVRTREIHTESGRHTKRLESWSAFRSGAGLSDPLPSSATAKKTLGELLPGAPWPR